MEFLRQYANAKGIIVDEVIEDYGRISPRYPINTSYIQLQNIWFKKVQKEDSRG